MIPTKYNEEQTLRVARKQDRITDKARDKTIYDFPYTAAEVRILKDLNLPANKGSLLSTLNRSDQQCERVTKYYLNYNK